MIRKRTVAITGAGADLLKQITWRLNCMKPMKKKFEPGFGWLFGLMDYFNCGIMTNINPMPFYEKSR